MKSLLKSSVNRYLLEQFSVYATPSLSLCSDNGIMLTPQVHSLIVAQSGKKWVKVGAYHRRRLKEEGAVFRGVTHLALDNKGRLAIPARHREALAHQAEGRLVLTADPSHCLLLYPLLAWEPIEQRLMGLSSFNEKTRALQRLLVGH